MLLHSSFRTLDLGAWPLPEGVSYCGKHPLGPALPLGIFTIPVLLGWDLEGIDFALELYLYVLVWFASDTAAIHCFEIGLHKYARRGCWPRRVLIASVRA